MKHLAIQYTPRAVVVFTMREVAIMLKTAEHHYDFVCQSCASLRDANNGQRPGLLVGIQNCMRNTSPAYEHVLTFRELDTLAKILEMAHLGFRMAKDLRRIADLRLKIQSTLESINKHHLESVQIEQP